MSNTDIEFTVRPVKALAAALHEYLYSSESVALNPEQDAVISALLDKIYELCDESLSKYDGQPKEIAFG